MSKSSVKRSGFTLVEVIVAMGIFAMVIAGALSGVHRGLNLVQDSRNSTRATQILQSELETLRTYSWKEMSKLERNVDLPVGSQFHTSNYSIFTLRRFIVAEEEGLFRVNLNVSYKSRGGRLLTLKYVTFFCKGGVNDYYYRTI